MVVERTTNERVTGHRKRGSLKLADVEYRVFWNEAELGWDVFRNGAATKVSARKKRKSAVDLAVQDARTESAGGASVVVTCLQGLKIETLWKGP
jgi:hypothetical protein